MRICVFTVLCLMAACSAEHPSGVANPSQYFPVKTGAWFIYAVDSAVINQGISTPFHYELMVEVTGNFIDAAGTVSWILTRSKRSIPTDDWSPITSWSARVDDLQLVIQEGNIPYVKLSTPLANGNVWNGNELNGMEGNERCPGSTSSQCDLFTVTDFGKQFTAPMQTFNETLTVDQSDEDDSVVSRDIRSEVYARNAGLISRKINKRTYQEGSGLDYTQTLTSYGGL